MRISAVRPWLGTIIRLLLGVVWIWAAWGKISSPRIFLLAVREYDVTPDWLSKAIAFGLPVLELCLGILLIIGIMVRIAAIASAVLYVVFLIGLIQAAARGLSLECGCFGGGGQTAGATQYTWDILRDIGLLALAAYLVVWPFTLWSLDEFLSRHDHVEIPSAKRMRSAQGRGKYEAEVAKRAATARSRNMWVNASLAAVVVLVVLIGIGVQSGRTKISGSVTATNATVANGVVFGKKAAATVDLYEDFQCPHCLDFEKSAGSALDALVRSNHAQVRFHMLAFLDSSSGGNQYSTRAANAALCASDVSVDTFVAYHKVLYGTVGGKQVQPAEGSGGRTDAQLEAYGVAAGIKGDAGTTFNQCVSTQKHKALVQAITDRASAGGITGTPTVKVNGKTVTATLTAVRAAIAAADAKGPAASPSVTPKPSSSAVTSSSAATSTSPAQSSSPKPATSTSGG